MNYHIPANFPAAPGNKEGWPWTNEQREREALPKISLITPCLNSAQFIEETIRSVLAQNYPNLEYIVVDGGSTDGTKEIIAKYQAYISHVICEQDAGQSDAINKGAKLATGDLINWLNADDILLPGALETIGTLSANNPGKIIAGLVCNIDLDSGVSRIIYQNALQSSMIEFWWPRGRLWHQPGIFVPLDLWNKVGGLDSTLEIEMDYDLYCKLSTVAEVVLTNSVLVEFKLHQDTKSSKLIDLYYINRSIVSKKYWRPNQPDWFGRFSHSYWVAREIATRIRKEIEIQRYDNASKLFWLFTKMPFFYPVFFLQLAVKLPPAFIKHSISSCWSRLCAITKSRK